MNKPEREDRKRDMFSLIREYQDSNMSARAFYRQHNVPEHIFYYWRRKYREVNSPQEQGFVPLEIGPLVLPPANDIRGDIQIHYPNGVLVTLDQSVSISRIKALIKAI